MLEVVRLIREVGLRMAIFQCLVLLDCQRWGYHRPLGNDDIRKEARAHIVFAGIRDSDGCRGVDAQQHYSGSMAKNAARGQDMWHGYTSTEGKEWMRRRERENEEEGLWERFQPSVVLSSKTKTRANSGLTV